MPGYGFSDRPAERGFTSERTADLFARLMSEGVGVPTGVVIFPGDIVPAPREFAERFFDLRRWTRMPRGGHFAAMEEPELLVEDLREFFRLLRATA